MSRDPANETGRGRSSVVLAALGAILIVAASTAGAAECGCATNGLVPQFGVNYGTSLDAGQTWQIIEGDPLMIAVGSKGAMAVWVCQPNGITRQYYSDDAWGTDVFLVE